MKRLDNICFWLLLALTCLAATGAEPKRVLFIQSFGRGFEPYHTVAGRLRTELASQMAEPIDFFEASLESARFTSLEQESPLLEYLQAQFAGHHLDLVIPIGGPATQFVQRHRKQLFPETPMLAAVDQRLFNPNTLTTNDASALTVNEPGLTVETLLQVLPETTNVVVVMGSSAIERFWSAQIRTELQPYTNRVSFVWLDQLPFTEMLKRCATLPPRSAIFFPLLFVDAAGVPHLEEHSMARLHEAANAPIFGVWRNQLGQGILGGRLIDIEEYSRSAANVAARLLRGESPVSIKMPLQRVGPPEFDWRELRRWGIAETRLPPGSLIRYRQPTLWGLYRWYIVVAVLFCLLQTALIVGLVTNALARKRADQVLRESEERMTLAAEAAQFGVWVWSIGRNRVWGSERWRGLLGFVPGQDFSFEEVIQRIHPDDRERVEREVRRALASRSDYAGDFRVLLPDGSQRWIASRGRVSPDANGTPARMMGAAVDITEAKRAAAEMQGLRLQLWHADRVAQTGAITASLAHELNQPLTGILSTAQAGLRFTADGNADCGLIREMLSNIVHDTKRAGGVINGLRAMLRHKETRREPIKLGTTIQEVLDLVHSELIGRQVQASQNLKPDLTVVADKGQVQQVLLNLIMNAVEAMQDQPAEQRRLTLALTRTETGEALVSLRDFGPGVSNGGQEKLFEAFWTTKKEGMGIGLAVSRSIIESHGGRLWFANNPDRGATFYFTLPVPSPSDSQGFRKEATSDAK